MIQVPATLKAAALKEMASKGQAKVISTVSRVFGYITEPGHQDRMNKSKAWAPVHELTAKSVMEEKEANQALVRWERELRINERLRQQEERRQDNLDAISVKAVAAVTEEPSDQPVDEDWMYKFMESCQDVGDAEMQSLWARILAGEVATPGRFSIRALQFVREMSKNEAELFTRFCSCMWTASPHELDLIPIVPDPNAFRKVTGINIMLNDLQHLDSIGLITLSNLRHVRHFTFNPSVPDLPVLGYELVLEHFGKKYRLIQKPEPNSHQITSHAGEPSDVTTRSLAVGHAFFTPLGRQLAPVSTPIENTEVRQICLNYFHSQGWLLDEGSGAGITR